MSIPLRVLIIEDVEDDAELLVQELRSKGYDPLFERVDTQKAMLEALDRQMWDIIICDYSMPGFNAISALELMHKIQNDLPFILVSGTIGEEVAVEAMKAGAHDYIMKDNLSRFVPAIQRELVEYKERRRVRKVEDQLRKLHRAIEHSPSTVIITDIEGKIEYVNPKFSDITGYSVEEVVGENPRIWSSGKQSHEFYKELWDTITSGKEWKGEFCNKKKSGELHWESGSISAVKNEEGVITNYVAVAEDITERRQMEEDVRRYNDDLETMVKVRTTRIMELERQRMENEKLTATGRMASRVAHEINNPLSGIKGGFMLVKDSIPKEHEYYEYVGIIEREVDRIARIVKQMFDLNRPYQGEISEFDSIVAIRDVISMLGNHGNEHGISLNINGCNETVKATMSEDYFRQILFNIIKNAIEASPEGGNVNVNVCDDDSRLKIIVSDQGSGISDELRFEIFEPFFTTKDKYSGSGMGLGLSTTKILVESMGGSLSFSSKEGKGTTFTIDLPINVVKEDFGKNFKNIS